MGKHSTSNRLAVEQPTRGADRNRALADQADPATKEMLLPSLEDGITLLDVEGGRGVPILQSLVLNHLLLHDGPAFWVDANGHATTTTLVRIAPSRRLLDRIHIARGFTAYPNNSTVCDLPTAVTQSIQGSVTSVQESTTSIQQSTTGITIRGDLPPGHDDASPDSPSLIVAPAVDAQYRADDTLGETHAETLQARTLARLTTYADGYDIPVLVTRDGHDDFTTPIATAADHHLKCEQTRMGPQVVGDDLETIVYPVDDGAYSQTTFAYWRQLLEARATQVGVESTTTQSTPTPDGTGITADGETVSVAADPMLDAWTAAGTGGP